MVTPRDRGTTADYDGDDDGDDDDDDDDGDNDGDSDHPTFVSRELLGVLNSAKRLSNAFGD
ncbi:hypothetical protein E2986_12089 [Frieseomelitta varia]|uniref:Uncharacterized protein n=1 Tax=Frieseomelitta varia TaxID=561572 RepID=A0A833WFJ1_9HYME|nr:hypothetical protein E2986_12089 [Frieseomelitta varia]